MLTLLHISDLHFGGAYAQRLGDAVLEAAERIAPDAVVASGDLVEWAEHSRGWVELRAFLRRFIHPLFAIPGNHDIERANFAGRLWRPFRAYRRFVHPDVDRSIVLSGAHVVGLGTPKRWTVDLGFLSRGQLEWAESELAGAAPGALKVVTVHHALRPVHPGLRKHIRGSSRAVKSLVAMGADLVLTGHSHFPHAEVITSDDGGRRMLWSQAGTATCRRLHGRARNCITVIRAVAEWFHVEWWHFRQATGRFEQAARESFPRAFGAAVAP